jgi:undecaprenyl diphosphate synthase
MFGKKKLHYSDEDIRKLVKDSSLRHIAFIMDGNGRWATSRSLPREAGHVKGAAAFKNVVHICDDFGIETLTVYAFSTENWKRPEREINAIMDLLESNISEAVRDDKKNNAKYRFLGDKDGLGEKFAKRCTELEKLTENNRLLLNIALNYGSRAEITNAVNRLIAEGKKSVTEDDISSALYTAHCPDPDLIVRSAGEFRLSNFLLWQAAYSEIYVTDTLWPDFDRNEVAKAIVDFSKRKRNFGAAPKS